MYLWVYTNVNKISRDVKMDYNIFQKKTVGKKGKIAN